MRQTLTGTVLRGTLLAGIAVGFLAGCEDGPTQTYKPAPDGAGNAWNDGNSSPSTDPSQQGFTGTLGGTNAIELCDAPTKKKVWSKAFSSPITPPVGGGNLVLSGQAGQLDYKGNMLPNTADTWVGLTVEQAEKVNCQSAPGGDWFGDGNFFNYWGDNQELVFEYLISTRKIVYLGFDPGYTGAIDFKSRDGMHTYKMLVNSQIQKDGSPYTITWDNNASTGKGVWANELTDALMYTFAPALPAEPPPNGCIVNGHCVIGTFGDQGYTYIPALGFAFRVANINAAQPTPSVTYYFDQYLAKTMSFSAADPVLKLDQLGPFAIASPLGPNNLTCNLHMGLNYGDFLSNCVRVTGDQKKDDYEQNKLLGGLTHGTERFHFDLAGVDVNFSDKTLAPDAVIGDKDRPSNDDVATTFRVDQATLGHISNDYQGNGAPFDNDHRDLHMTGLIYAEFARQVQERVNYWASQMYSTTHQFGDAACLTGDPQDAANAHCSGFEGFVVPINTSRVNTGDADVQAVQALAVNPGWISGATGFTPAKFTALKRGLKPGHQYAYFCDGTGHTQCSYVDIMPGSFARLLKVFGQGQVSMLPPEMQDARFFFDMWSRALFKFLLTENTSGTTNLQTVKYAPLQNIDMFHDSLGSGQFEIAEYVDRRFVSSSQDLTDMTFTADVKNGIMNDFSFSRDIFRGEEAMYTSIRENSNDPAGKEQNALLTNMFGSPLLKGYWTGGTNGKTAYDCATYDSDNDVATYNACGGQMPPLDDQGHPVLDDDGTRILTRYKGAFTSSGSIFRLGTFTPISVKKEYPNITSVMLTFPQHSDPYDTASPPPNGGPSSLDFLVPWSKKQPGIGFNIAINGQQNKFISCYEADLAGTTLSVNFGYDWVDPKNPNKGIAPLSAETTDYLGSVFLCMDPNDNTMLHAHMYTPVAHLLDWINKHAQAASDCGIIVRYSPYGNYPDYITSVSNGVELGITQGGGFGRVVETDLFAPGQ